MAKLYLRTNPDGTYRIRGIRLAGKELAAQRVVTNVSRADLKKEVVALMDIVAPAKITRSST